MPRDGTAAYEYAHGSVVFNITLAVWQARWRIIDVACIAIAEMPPTDSAADAWERRFWEFMVDDCYTKIGDNLEAVFGPPGWSKR